MKIEKDLLAICGIRGTQTFHSVKPLLSLYVKALGGIQR